MNLEYTSRSKGWYHGLSGDHKLKNTGTSKIHYACGWKEAKYLTS